MRACLLGVVWVLLAAGCGLQVREARALQPNPVTTHTTAGDPPLSVPLHIYQGHYLLPGVKFRHWAQFAAVSRDRLRFHVGILGYNEGDADTREWRVWLEDEQGRKLACEREVPRMNRFWARGHDVYEGEADYVIHEPGLMSRDTQRLSLVVRRDGLEYRYTWTFGDRFEINDYGYRMRDRELGIISVPGPHTPLEGTTYEDGR